MALPVGAVPIVYEGTLVPGETVGGFVQAPGFGGAPNDDFWRFSGEVDDVITLSVNRLDPGLNPGMDLFVGTGDDTFPLGFPLAFDFDSGVELPGFEGAGGDPRISVVLPETGDYTVHVYDSTLFGDPPPAQREQGYCYQLTLNGEPTSPRFQCGPEGEPQGVVSPGSLALFAAGLFGLVGAGRRRRPIPSPPPSSP